MFKSNTIFTPVSLNSTLVSLSTVSFRFIAKGKYLVLLLSILNKCWQRTVAWINTEGEDLGYIGDNIINKSMVNELIYITANRATQPNSV